MSLDASTLLFPYTVSSQTLAGIAKVLGNLADEGRLLITGQAAREYAKNRVKKIAEIKQQVANLRSTAKVERLKRYPILEGHESYAEADAAYRELDRHIKAYGLKLSRLVDDIQQLTDSDPVSEMYGRVIDRAGIVLDPVFDESSFIADANERFSRKIPPGYKDAAKDDGGFGDLIIWRTLLENAGGSGRDLIFVTSDEKPDWWHQESGSALVPRYELIDEYRRVSGGGALHLVKLSRFLELASSVDAGAVDEVRRLERLQADPAVRDDGNAVLLPDGKFIAVHGEEGVAIIRPVKQEARSVDCDVWYVPFPRNGSVRLDNSNASRIHVGEGEAVPPWIYAGPFIVEWSVGGPGAGWFYRYGASGVLGGPKYELTPVDAQGLSAMSLDVHVDDESNG